MNSGVFIGEFFCVSGSFSISQGEMKSLIEDNGGNICSTVNKQCTGVISNTSGTTKTNKAEELGLPVHDEQWVQKAVNGNMTMTDDKTKSNNKRKSINAAKDEKNDDDNDNNKAHDNKEGPTSKKGKGSDSKVFSNLTFCISGSFEISQGEMKSLLTQNGGKIASSVTKSVTHVIANEIGSGKTSKAEELGVPVVSEEWVTDSIEQGKLSKKGFVSEDGNDEGDEEDEEDEEDYDDEDADEFEEEGT